MISWLTLCRISFAFRNGASKNKCFSVNEGLRLCQTSQDISLSTPPAKFNIPSASRAGKSVASQGRVPILRFRGQVLSTYPIFGSVIRGNRMNFAMQAVEARRLRSALRYLTLHTGGGGQWIWISWPMPPLALSRCCSCGTGRGGDHDANTLPGSRPASDGGKSCSTG